MVDNKQFYHKQQHAFMLKELKKYADLSHIYRRSDISSTGNIKVFKHENVTSVDACTRLTVIKWPDLVIL